MSAETSREVETSYEVETSHDPEQIAKACVNARDELYKYMNSSDKKVLLSGIRYYLGITNEWHNRPITEYGFYIKVGFFTIIEVSVQPDDNSKILTGINPRFRLDTLKYPCDPICFKYFPEEYLGFGRCGIKLETEKYFSSKYFFGGLKKESPYVVNEVCEAIDAVVKATEFERNYVKMYKKPYPYGFIPEEYYIV
jgi:hypothetical protein